MADHVARRGPVGAITGALRALTGLKVRAVLALGMVIGITASATGAFWSQTVAVPGVTFSAGRIDLQVADTASGTYAFTTLGLTNLLPGNSVAATIPVQNKGQAAKLRYAMDAKATGTLGAALQISVYAGGTATQNGFTGTCSGTQLGSTTTLSATDQTVVTTAITDARPAIAPAAAETLCIRIELPTSADASLIGQTTQTTLTFRAKSVQN